MSIKLRFTIVFVLLISFIMFVVSGFTLYKVREAMLEDGKKIAEGQAMYASAETEAYIEIALDEARAMAGMIEGSIAAGYAEREAVIASLREVAKDNSEILGTWVVFEKNTFDGKDVQYVNLSGHDASGRFVPYLNKDKSGKVSLEPCTGYETSGTGDYYVLARDTNKEVVVEPFSYVVGGETIWMTSLAVPIHDKNGKVIGVAGTDIDLKHLTEIAKKAKLFETGYISISSNQGIYAVHPKLENIGKNHKELLTDKEVITKEEVAKKGENAVTFAKSLATGQESMKIYVPFSAGNTGSNWVTTAVVPINEVMAAADKLQKIVIVINLIGLILLAVGVWWGTCYLTVPINMLAKQLETLAHKGGDLTQKIILTRKDEIGFLANCVNEFIASLRDIMLKVVQKAETVAAAAQQMTSNAEESARAANNVAHFATKVAEETQIQADLSADTNDSMMKISGEIAKVNSNVNHAAAEVDKAAAMAEEGSSRVAQVIQQMCAISGSTQSASKAIDKLNERSQEIGNIVDVIMSIAGQTNLLALNAAIEAARAGEHGRGFSVVADEVRKLAEQSQESAKIITALIAAIRDDTEQAVEMIKAGTGDVNMGLEIVDKTGESFSGIIMFIAEASEKIKDAAELADRVSQKSRRAVVKVQEVSGIAMDNISQMQNISAVTEEQSAASEQISSSSDSLAQLAEEMQLLVRKFKI